MQQSVAGGIALRRKLPSHFSSIVEHEMQITAPISEVDQLQIIPIILFDLVLRGI